MLYISTLFPSSLFLYQPVSLCVCIASPIHPLPLLSFLFPSSLGLNVLESCCLLINVFDFTRSLFLSLCRRRRVLFLIKVPGPELTQRTTKSYHHQHHHPWEPINNSACCPVHQQTLGPVLLRALIHRKQGYSLKTNNKDKMANTSL